MSQPDWVILGVDHAPDGVIVIASTRMILAQLDMEIIPEMLSWADPYRTALGSLGRSRITLRLEMADFVMVHAPTYEEAMRNLFSQWSPQPSRRTPEINPPAPELEP